MTGGCDMGRGLGSLCCIAAIAVALSGGLAGLNAPAASADGLHLLPRFWMGGCRVDYSLDARSGSQYAVNVAHALAAIAAITGIAFSRVERTGPLVSIRFAVIDGMPSQEMGLASTGGDIQLADVSQLPAAHDAVLDNALRDRIVAHEVLHVLGLAHDEEAWSLIPDELMNPRQSWRPLQFGAGDKTGMAYVRSVNHCAATA